MLMVFQVEILKVLELLSDVITQVHSFTTIFSDSYALDLAILNGQRTMPRQCRGMLEMKLRSQCVDCKCFALLSIQALIK